MLRAASGSGRTQVFRGKGGGARVKRFILLSVEISRSYCQGEKASQLWGDLANTRSSDFLVGNSCYCMQAGNWLACGWCLDSHTGSGGGEAGELRVWDQFGLDKKKNILSKKKEMKKRKEERWRKKKEGKRKKRRKGKKGKKEKEREIVHMRMPFPRVYCVCENMFTCVHVCRSQVNVGCLPQLFSTFLWDRSLTQPGAHSCARLAGWWAARILQGPPPRYWGCRHVMWMLEIQTGPHACYSKCFFYLTGPSLPRSLSSKYSCLSILIAGIMHMLYHTLPSLLLFFFLSKRKLKHLGVLEPRQTMGL